MAQLKFIQLQLRQTYSNLLKRTTKQFKLFKQKVLMPMCQKAQNCQSGRKLFLFDHSPCYFCIKIECFRHKRPLRLKKLVATELLEGFCYEKARSFAFLSFIC